MPQKTLVLFSTTYPYQAFHENTFLQPEITWLCQYFDRVVLAPRFRTASQFPLPANTAVENSFADIFAPTATKAELVMRTLLSGMLPQEFPAIWNSSQRVLALKQLAWSLHNARRVRDWLAHYVVDSRIDLANTLFYTYWLGDTAFGVSLLKQRMPEIKLISRAHRVDLYEERREYGYIPGRRLTLKRLNQLFLISQHGKEYLANKYPAFSNKLTLARLGVKNAGFLNVASADGEFRLVSCSALTPVKRVDRLAQVLIEVGQKNPKQLFRWYHFGDGECRGQVDHIVKNLPSNVSANLCGKVSNEEIYKFYMDHPVDLFVNLSASEGLPVSIMEAQSVGIPVLATAVGGTPEIVGPENGWLLSADISTTEIADTVISALFSLRENAAKRRASVESWALHYNADQNYQRFAQHLSTI